VSRILFYAINGVGWAWPGCRLSLAIGRTTDLGSATQQLASGNSFSMCRNDRSSCKYDVDYVAVPADESSRLSVQCKNCARSIVYRYALAGDIGRDGPLDASGVLLRMPDAGYAAR
jgi:hypothetical protein